jgi:4-hydroxy-3-polyprenylbenzoate decarboxylase
MTPHPQSVRAFLGQLEARGWLKAVAEEVDPLHEISAYFCFNGAGPALRFDQVPGFDMRVFGNLLCDRERIALGLAAPLHTMQDRIVAAIRAPVDTVFVDAAACQEIAVERPDLAALPVPTFFEHETGPYLTAGAIVARDPESGRANLSFARLKLLGGNRALIGIAPNHHLAIFARRAQAAGRRLQIAATFGNHPAVLIAGALYLGLGEDELRVAGALFGAPVQAARTANGGLAVPAHCEIVLEGEIDAGTMVEEGPVSEYHGMYELYGPGYLVEFSRMTRRHDAMLQVIQPGYAPEHVWIGAEAIAASLAHRLRGDFPKLRQVAITPGGAGRLHAVASLADPAGSDALRLMEATWNAVHLVKRVTVVDADVDPWDPVRVELALATRMRAERDLLVVPGAKTNRSDPLQSDGLIAKLGIDATRKDGDRGDWRPAEPPAAVMQRVARTLKPRTN